MRPNLDRLLMLALLAVAGFVGARLWLESHPEHNPWAPLDLSDPPGWATARKLARLRDNPAECRAVLERSEIEFIALPPTGAGDCRRPDRGIAPALGLRPAKAEATCAVAAGMVLWLRNGVQPAARRLLDSQVTAIEHFGTYSCRRMYDRDNAPWSEHATGNAIDVSAFLLADGRRISVREDWSAEGTSQGFLRAAHESACGSFGTVLGPAYNAAHADHFHLDQASGRIGWSVCR